MHLLGEPVPKIMDGQVLTGIFREPEEIVYTEDSGEELDIDSSQALSEEESAQVEERLRSLGYL
jgi:hypothetical protein